MKEKIVITDLTRMKGNRVCIAGYTAGDKCVRPVLWGSHLIERWLCSGEQVIVRPFALVELDFQESVPEPPHTEDRIIHPVYRELCGMLPAEERRTLLERITDKDVASIFGAPVHQEQGWYVSAGEGERSLGTVVPSRVWDVTYGENENTGKWEYRLRFSDASVRNYGLAVTDLAFRYVLDHLRTQREMPPDEAAATITAALQRRHVYLRIGLSRHWEEHPDRCYLQVTGIHTFPDYLKGKCFADFSGK